jgi:arylsulfatase A-like enzyme
MALNIDLAPTVLALAGCPVPPEMQGRSLLPLLRGSDSGWRREFVAEHLWDHPKIPQTEALRTEGWKYIRYPRHPEFEELYDLRRDPLEERNKISERKEKAAELRARLDDKLAGIQKNGSNR